VKNLSTKELNYLNDFLSWELLSCKKCYQYANQEINTAHQKVFFDAARTHQQNYTNLLSYVEQVNKTTGGQLN